MRHWISVACLGLVGGCVESVTLDAVETGRLLPLPLAEFDPGSRILPLPNALLIDPATGRINLPQACGEMPDSAAARLRAALNQLDGFATSQANLVATFSQPVDPGSLTGRVFLVRIAERGEPLPTFEGAVAVDVAPATSLRFSPDCAASAGVPNLTIRPRAPLAGASTYAVVLLAGIQTETEIGFVPSATWALVRQAQPPVVFSSTETDPPRLTHNETPFDPETAEGLASLQGLDRLWRAHAPLLAAIDQLAPALTAGQELLREDILLAWAFNTQTLVDPFDPALEGSPAAALALVPDTLSIPAPLAGEGAPLSVEQFYASALPNAPCSALGCDAIGWIYAGSAVSQAPGFVSPSFLEGDDCDPATAVPVGAFGDPLRPSKVCDQQLSVLAVIPREPPTAGGYPTVIFAHGFGRSKEDVLAIAGALARSGIASVALDAVDHGVRAVQVSADAALGCDGPGPGKPCPEAFGPTCAPQCFAPILSSDLPVTRDHLRQTVLDQLKLERVLQACAGADVCGRLRVDATRIGYLGHSLGSLLGGVSVAVSHMPAAVLNEAAGDWVGVLTETATDRIRCPLVDALIAGGVLAGETWGLGTNPNALCLADSWKTEPRFREFAAAARWLLDPIDPVNYAARYRTEAGPVVLVAEVADDPVIPGSATLSFATLLGLAREPAAVAASALPTPSAASLAPGSHWIVYRALDADSASMFPGNAYGPGSLLAPAAPAASMGAASGQLGTALMQTDTLAYLVSHL